MLIVSGYMGLRRRRLSVKLKFISTLCASAKLKCQTEICARERGDLSTGYPQVKHHHRQRINTLIH